MNLRSYTAVTVLFFLALLLSGCGRKTALVPPQRLVPVRINDLGYVLDEKGVTLRWSYPTKMENGDALQAIESFEVQRAVVPEEDFCQGCPIRYEEPVEIGGGRLVPSGETRTAKYTEGYLQEGYRYLYKVRSRSGRWSTSGDSNVISFLWRVPPKTPQDLLLESRDGAITLTWKPVTEDTNGNELAQAPVYQVYRKKYDNDFIALGEPVRETEFKDAGLVNNVQYFYKVHALLAYTDTLQAGGASQIISGFPRDLTPPEQPKDLVAVAIAGGVKLAWQPVRSADLAGYRIYRRGEESAVPELIAEMAPDQNQYIDRSATSGRNWFYSVTSFDAAEPVNESLPAEEAVINLQ